MDEPIRTRGPSDPPSPDEGTTAGGAAPGDRQLQRELSTLKGQLPSFGTAPGEVLSGYLDELERLCAKATPGPWRPDEANGFVLVAPDDQDVVGVSGLRTVRTHQANARFIEAARHALPKLIEKVRELQADLDRADKRLRFETTKDDSERQRLGRELREVRR